MIVLESSVLIELFRKEDKQNTFFYQISNLHSELSISAITYYEIGVGNKKLHSDYWDRLCESFTILPFDKTCSDSAIKIYLDLLKKI